MFDNIAYVTASGSDVTGRIGNPAKPYATPSAALLSGQNISAGLTIKAGIGSFNSPPQSLLSRDNLTIIGSGNATPNWNVQQLTNNGISLSTPTRLAGGTIFKGKMYFFNVAKLPKIYNFGIDVGSDFVAAGGEAADGIVVYQTGSDEALATNVTPYPLATGLEIKNVTTLCQNPNAPYHGLVIQGAFAPTIEDVTTVHGVHGFAFKTTMGRFGNLMAVNHGQNGIIVKSNPYSNANKNIINGFHTYGCPYGVTIQNRNIIVMRDLILNNGFIEGGATGIRTIDDALSGSALGFQGLHFNNIHVRNATNGFVLSGHTQSSARNCYNNGTLVEFNN